LRFRPLIFNKNLDLYF